MVWLTILDISLYQLQVADVWSLEADIVQHHSSQAVTYLHHRQAIQAPLLPSKPEISSLIFQYKKSSRVLYEAYFSFCMTTTFE